jgi:hypothetical protein
MKDERESRSLQDVPPVSLDDGHAEAARSWRAPTVTRMSLEQTLFFTGSITDGATGSSPS